MRAILGLAVVVLVAIIAWLLGQVMNSDQAAMGIGMLIGILMGVPMALMAANGQRRVDHHHTHDVRIIPQRVRSVMVEHGANDAIKIDGQWILLDGDQVVPHRPMLMDR